MTEELMRPGIEPRGNGRQGQDWALVVYQIGGKVYSVEGPIDRVEIERNMDDLWTTLPYPESLRHTMTIEFSGDVVMLAKDLER